MGLLSGMAPGAWGLCAVGLLQAVVRAPIVICNAMWRCLQPFSESLVPTDAFILFKEE